jgi:hypothetical protein
MKLTTNNLIILFGILALCVLAMFPISVLAFQFNNQPPADPQATVQAMVTQTVISMTLNAPTQTPPPPTVTADPATNTPLPTPTSVPPTAASYCDWAAFVKDVTVEDGTTFAPGEVFIKTWRLKNRGTCGWTTDYMLVFHSGSQLGGTTAVRLPANVPPGQTVDVSVTLTAPSTGGSYIGYWMLRNSSGVVFGTGTRANTPFYVDIRVRKDNLSHGTVSGSLCYPSEFNPPMTLYFGKAGSAETIQFAIAENQLKYNVLLPVGRYYVYAWASGYNLEGAYTHPNGLMKSIEVKGGQATTEIHLCDWSPDPHARGE